MTAQTTTEPAVLVLEDGRVFRGRAYGATGTALGEAVFATGMTGYQETITDPSYARQLVVQTAPHIGNTGVNHEDAESRRIWVAGYVVRDAARRPSNWRSERSLDEELAEQGVVGISGVDTRAITRHLRERGAMRAGIFSGADAARPEAELLDDGQGAGVHEGFPPGRGGRHRRGLRRAGGLRLDGRAAYTVAALDLGIKSHDPAALRRARHAGARAARHRHRSRTSWPWTRTACSSPTAPATPPPPTPRWACCARSWTRRLPFFGICFGNQILGRALGFGHLQAALRPPRHQPAGHGPDHRQGGDHRAEPRLRRRRAAGGRRHRPRPASAASRSPTSASTTRSSRGCSCLDIPAFSVQYHPEAAAGPHDAAYLFDRFIDVMAQAKTGAAADSKGEK